MKHNTQTLESRRGFLRSSLALGAAGVATIALTSQKANADVVDRETQAHKMPAQGYRMTPHIAAYYKTASL